MYSKSDQTKKNKPPKLKRRKCKTCKEWFKTDLEHKRVCDNVECAISFGKVALVKQREQTKRAFKQNDKSVLREKAVKAFNAFIRQRDINLPCISCGHTNGRQFHAGHYKPAGGNPHLRFNELNVHKQCSICNNYRSGNLAEYRLSLIKKIGLINVEALESDKSVKKYSEEDYKSIIVKYKMKFKEIQ